MYKFLLSICLKNTVELNRRSTDFRDDLDVIFDLVHIIKSTEKMSAPPLIYINTVNQTTYKAPQDDRQKGVAIISFEAKLKENNENLWFSSQDSKNYFFIRGESEIKHYPQKAFGLAGLS